MLHHLLYLALLAIPLKAETTPESVEHVFFRSKNEIHMTRSRWLVGIVIDFAQYENYLLYTEKTIAQASNISHEAETYFQRLHSDPMFRSRVYQATKTELNPQEATKLQHYHNIMSSQERELEALSKMHAKSMIDFKELKQVGHSELEESRRENRQNPRSKRFIALAAGIFSGMAYFETQKLKGEVNHLRENQQVIRHVLKESLSLINITRMEVNENRHTINKIIDDMGKMVQTWSKSFTALVNRVEPLQRFVISHAQNQANLNLVRDLVTAETALIADLHSKISKLSSQKLSPNLLPAPELVKILKSIEVELPNRLMLPRDPRETPWYYYTMLQTDTLALEDQLVITIEIPLLDVARLFKVKEAISLPVPYGKTNITAEYELEFKNFAISADGREYVILTLEDQINCGKPGVNFCAMSSAIYETNRHQYCTLALYQRDLRKIKDMCKVQVTNKLKMPLAKYISEGQWLVATNQNFYLRKLCVKTEIEEHVVVSPPFQVVHLESGCRALADKLELPIYFEGKSEYKVVRETRITTPIRQNLTDLPIWQPIQKYNLDLNVNLKKLPPMEPKPIEDLIDMLEATKNKGKYQIPDSKLPYVVIAIVVLLILLLIMVVCLKRNAVIRVLAKRVISTLGFLVQPSTSSSTEPSTNKSPDKSVKEREKKEHRNNTNSRLSQSGDSDNSDINDSSPGAQISKTGVQKVFGARALTTELKAPTHMLPSDICLELGTLNAPTDRLGTSDSRPSSKPRPRPRTTLKLSRRDK